MKLGKAHIWITVLNHALDKGCLYAFFIIINHFVHCHKPPELGICYGLTTYTNKILENKES
jgi:hypothetical protein